MILWFYDYNIKIIKKKKIYFKHFLFLIINNNYITRLDYFTILK